MPWARIDDGFDDHPKIVALMDDDQGLVAIGLWTVCLTWAHRNTRKPGKIGGLLPSGLPRRYAGQSWRHLADLLVIHGLWELSEDGGWFIHDFDQYLTTEKLRAQRSESGKKGAASRWKKQESETDISSIDAGTDGNLPSSCHDVAIEVDGKPMASAWQTDDNPMASAWQPDDDAPGYGFSSSSSVGLEEVELQNPSAVVESRTTAGAPKRPKPPKEDPDFVAFWSAYPRKIDKGHARQAFAKATDKASPEAIIAAAKAFTKLVRAERRPVDKIPHPATWLNGERWADEPDQPTHTTDWTTNG